MANNHGFTLLEVLIAMIVLTVGLFGVAIMQTKAIDSNSTAISRSNANAVALSFMEELQRLDFDDPVLADGAGGLAGVVNGTAGLADGEAAAPGQCPALVATPADQSILTANFLNNLPGLGNTYRIVGAGRNTRLVDEANREYLIFYNVDSDPWGDGSAAFCLIRLYVYWQSSLGGVSHLELTTTKHNNS